jgi:TolA-binding protein
MARHGCFSISRGSLVVLNGLVLIGSAFLVSGCAGAGSRLKSEQTRQEVTARKLRKAQLKIENLKERNQILRMRLKMLTRAGAVTPLNGDGLSAESATDPLKGFEPGVVTDVPLDSRKPVKPSKPDLTKSLAPDAKLLDLRAVGQIPKQLPKKSRIPSRQVRRMEAANVAPRQPNVLRADESLGEQADRALLRTMLGQIKANDLEGAERTLRILEKSYPESQVFGEARFQMGLYHYRSRKNLATPRDMEMALRSADFQFAEALRQKSLAPRVQAGSALMRGVIARLLLERGGESRNREIAHQNFEFVIQKYPKTMEARRAKREMAAMDRRTL